jgi:Na+/H+ antiporter NhaD/arsenite permease-like protein
MSALTGPQWTALGIFVLAYGLIISNKVHRTIAAILGAVLVALFVLTPQQLLKYENWETLLFVFGMMTVIATLEASGFFRWLGLHAAKAVRLDPLKLFILFPFIAAFLSAFVDSITVMLFMATLTIEVSKLVKINPLPLILAEISAANVGGASTMVGDPPNVILGTYFHLSFMDFVRNTGPAALIGFVVSTGLFVLAYRRPIFERRRELHAHHKGLDEAVRKLDPAEAIEDRHLFWVGLLGITYVVIMLVTHHLTHLSVATVAITGATMVLIIGGPLTKMPSVMKKVDWDTLLFFACLFLIVGAMDEVGLLRLVAESIINSTGGNYTVILSIILWFAAIASSAVDNVPMAATMAPLLHHISQSAGLPLPPLIWGAALGTDIGGNGTPIGASANVVAVATYEQATNQRISWAEYCKFSYPIMMATIFVLNVYLLFAYRR